MPYTRKKSLLLCAFAAAAAITAAAAAIKAGGLSAVFECGEAQAEFIIREQNGMICVFHGQYGDIPAIVTDIYIDKLGQSDRERLNRGIRAATREEVLMYLEDFGS
jgi:opacity protein-like surface antigen